MRSIVLPFSPVFATMILSVVSFFRAGCVGVNLLLRKVSYDFNLIGQSLGRYHIVEQLGEGGMASVFKGYDTSLERFVAVKVIRTDKGQDTAFLQRFQREAKALARLEHPYILKVLDYGEQDGMPYLVMPFIPGGTLKEQMGRPIAAARAAGLLAPIARALEYAHAQNIIHRDIKPANILIGPSGAPLLSDFGIAKMLDQEENATQLTGTGVGIGTPDYMAPEQWMGKADPRTDVYSLGVVFFEMLTGRKPYTADTPAAVLLKHVQDPLPPPRSFAPNLPLDAEQALYKSLAKKPEERYQEVGAFAAALEALAAGTAHPVPGASSTATVLETDLPVQAGPAATALQPSAEAYPLPPAASPSRKQMPKLLIGAGAVGVVMVTCLVLAGILFLLRSYIPGLAPTATATPTANDSTLGTLPAPTPGKEGQAATAVQPPAPTLTAGLQAPTATLPPITAIEGIPADIPIFSDNNGDLITNRNESMDMYTFTTDQDPAAVLEYYTKELAAQGWELVNTSEYQGQTATMLVYMKDETRTVMVNVSSTENGTMFSLMLPKQQ